MRRAIGFTCFTITLLLQTTAASAGPILYNNRTAFEAQGTITYRSYFDDFGAGYTEVHSWFLAGDAGRFTRGDVTYASPGGGFAAGPATGFAGNQEHTLLFALDVPNLLALIAEGPQYQMLGFDAGIWGPGTATLFVSTNLGTHIYEPPTFARTVNGELEFWGFVLRTEGEYFTSLRIAGLYPTDPSLSGAIPLPGVTNVVVGQVNGAVVPEPTSISLLALGLAGLISRAYRARFPRRVNRV